MSKYPKGYKRVTKDFKRRVSKLQRTKKLVDGGNLIDKATSLIRSGAPYAKSIGALAREVMLLKDMVNVESKFVDTAGSGSITNTGTVGILSLIAQGNTDQTRNGNQIKLKSIQIKIDLMRNTAAANNRMRVMLLVDKEYDGSNPTIADILQTANPLAPMNKDFSKRFVILKTKHIVVNAGYPSASFTWFTKLPFHTFYDGATAAQADCKENQILIAFVSAEAADQGTYVYYSRLNYYDN